MARFVAFDVETPNRWNDRMSAIGITIVEDGEVVEEFYSLVDPEEPFDSFNVQLTGIDEQAVWGQPNFGELWPVIEPLMSSTRTMSRGVGSTRFVSIEDARAERPVTKVLSFTGYAPTLKPSTITPLMPVAGLTSST